MSWKSEVIADSSGKWSGNGLRFETKSEAERYVRDLSNRWLSVRDTRAVECDDPVTHLYLDGDLAEIPNPGVHGGAAYDDDVIEGDDGRLSPQGDE